MYKKALITLTSLNVLLWSTYALFADNSIVLIEETSAPPKLIIPVKPLQDSSKKLKKKDLLEIININTAPVDILVRLPGIGKKTAEKIIVYRQSNGLFQKKDDLLKIKGIGKKKLSRIVPLIVLQ